MKTSATNRKLRLLLTGIQNQTLIPRPEFQRRLVWSNKHKLAFLKTVLDQFPFPEIYIASGEVDSATGEGDEMLVDGQQRITTLYQYFKASPDLKLDPKTKPYLGLTEPEKLAFLEYEVVIRDLGKLPIPDILEVFRRINSTNYALNSMEVHNARFDGDFKEFGEELAGLPFFEQTRFWVATLIATMNWKLIWKNITKISIRKTNYVSSLMRLLISSKDAISTANRGFGRRQIFSHFLSSYIDRSLSERSLSTTTKQSKD